MIVLAAGAGVPDAAVTLEDEGGGAIRRRVTDRRGLFTVPLLVPGTYAVLVEKAGVQPFRQRGVTILADQETRLTITVSHRPPPITSVEESATPEQQFVPGTPRVTEVLGGSETERDNVRLDFAETGRFSTSIIAAGPEGWGLGTAIGSLPGSYSRLSIDGLPAFTFRHPGLQLAPAGLGILPPYLLQETRLVASAADAEVRAGPAGAVRVVSKPGTRDFLLEPFVAWGTSPGIPSELNQSGTATRNVQAGALISGTLVTDKARFVVGGHYESLTLPSARPWTADNARLGAGTVPLAATIARIAQDSFGIDASAGTSAPERTYRGGIGSIGFEWDLGPQHRLTLRAAGGRHTERNPQIGRDLLNGSDADLDARDLLGSLSLTSSWTRASNEFRVGLQSVSREWNATSPVATYLVAEGAGIGAPPVAPAYFKRSSFGLVESLQFQFGTAGEHRLKVGLSYAEGPWQQDYVYGRQGIYQFGNLDGFASASGSYTDIVAPRTGVRFRLREVGLFTHLQWRFTGGLMAVAGLRWDWQKFPSGALIADTSFARAFGFSSNRKPEDNLNLSPRLGVTWASGRSTATFVGAVDNGVLNPERFAEVMLDRRSLAVRRSIGTFGGWPVAPDTSVLPPGGRRFAVFSPTDGYRNPRTAKLDLELSHVLPGGFSARLTGRYHHTDYLLRRSDLNLPATPTGTTNEGRAIYGTLVQVGALLVARPGSNRRVTNFDLVSALASTGTQDFSEAALQLGRDFGPRLRLTATYSLSRTRDNWLQSWSGDPADELSPFPNEPLARGWAKGVSDLDVPQRVLLAATWHSTGRVHLDVAGRFRYQSGFPFTPGFQPGVDANGDGSSQNDPAYLDPLIPGLSALASRHDCLGAQVGRFARRNSCRDPGRRALDLGAVLAVPVRSLGSRIELTLDVINLVASRTGVVDHALVLVDPAGTLGTGPGGQVILPLVANPRFGNLLSRRDEPRIVRVGLRLGNW
jgi:outer membrane receptor protein involved in Fe transport